MDTTIYQEEKTADEILKTVLTNCIKMITARKILKEENLQKNINDTINKINIDLTFQIPVDKYTTDSDKIYIIKIMPEKVTSVSKTSSMIDFLSQHKNIPKIMIVKNISKKAIQLITTNYPKTEVFLEEEFMINIIDNEFVPKHEILSPEETQEFFESYDCKKKNVPKIYHTDPIARYYNMPVGSICKITRPSKTSGFVPFYRLVIKGSF